MVNQQYIDNMYTKMLLLNVRSLADWEAQTERTFRLQMQYTTLVAYVKAVVFPLFLWCMMYHITLNHYNSFVKYSLYSCT